MSAEDLGVDARARELLETLPEDKQQEILQKLSDGLDNGKVRNASAYVASACMKPEALGIDDRAAELLNQLPKSRRKEVLDKLKNTEGVKNPSAWVAKACLKDVANLQHFAPMAYQPAFHQQQWEPVFARGGKGGHGFGGHGGYGGMAAPSSSFRSAPPRPAPGGDGRLDASANKLLQSLPVSVRKEIMAKLKQETGVRNPSAWVARAAIKAGATPQRAEEPSGVDLVFNLDAQAQELLATLPVEEQEHILDKLQAESGVRNPSAWVAKAALSAGAAPRSRSGASQHSQRLGLDPQAQQLLQTLGPDQQEEIMAKLEEAQAAGQVRNPSGWVVKAALNAGAAPHQGQAPQIGKGKAKGKGKGRFSPY